MEGLGKRPGGGEKHVWSEEQNGARFDLTAEIGG